ncbi:hypothetical protein H4Q26_004679 [Puccinia striiformis f. sp. tritici PST-130]|nr:hypothetical protein H4Q26_004679 [Puccinia striiformis f. sp. tritici PST-130]
MSRVCHFMNSQVNRGNVAFPAHVFLDLFGTLIYPTSPIHIRYNQVAQFNGFSSFNLSANNFKTAFKQTNQKFPNYGKNYHLTHHGQGKNLQMSPKDWWLKVIKDTFIDSLNSQDKQSGSKMREIEELSELIYEDFQKNENEEIYKNYDDTITFINYLIREGINFSILTNSDPKIMNALPPRLKSLLSSSKDTNNLNNDIQVFTSWDLGYTKPDKRIWDFAISKLNLSKSNNRLIHVGDDFQEDFLGAKSADLESIWLHRLDNHQKISKPIQNYVGNYEFKQNERIHSLDELCGFL